MLAFKMSETIETSGDRLKRLRKAKNLRQEDLARLVGIKPQSIGAIERNSSDSYKMPEIADALGVSLHYLRTGEKNSPLKLVENGFNVSEDYSFDDIANCLPGALNKTANTVRSILFKQGQLVNGDFSFIEHKELLLRVMTKAILMEISGDIQISGFDPADTNNAKN
jgi:transcriptional regulator with XRE-family HTH domain